MIENLLNQRQSTHGDFSHASAMVQLIKHRLRAEEGWRDMLAAQREAMEMIVHKIGRIIHGNPHEADHWRDIAGYALLAVREIETLAESQNKGE